MTQIRSSVPEQENLDSTLSLFILACKAGYIFRACVPNEIQPDPE